ALFSMTTLWPSSRDSASATGRATVSATPPGGNGTIMVTARSGYCAWAQHAARPSATPHHHLLALTAMSPTLQMGRRRRRRLLIYEPIGSYFSSTRVARQGGRQGYMPCLGQAPL